MRLTKIEIDGYKRLVGASCNVAGKLVAFVGPNEAGKSSVLQALDWLTRPNSGPIRVADRSRGSGPISDDHVVVRATFELDSADQDALGALDTDSPITHFVCLKTAGGQLRTRVLPSVWRRIDHWAEAAVPVAQMGDLVSAWPEDKRDAEANALFQATEQMLTKSSGVSDDEERQVARQLITWLNGIADERDTRTTKRGRRSARKATAALEAALDQAEKPHPAEAARQMLGQRRPSFLLFEASKRTLESSYDLSDEDLQDDPPQPLVDLLDLAGLAMDELPRLRATGDETRLATALKNANLRLTERLQPTWRQSDLTVHLDREGDLLQVQINELQKDGPVTPVSERSDGLRTFLALVCFVAASNLDRPILMIDEAENHLHYNAQADLINVLQNKLVTSKIIYTTHSPGCLPMDLGRGIRLVASDHSRPQVSKLRSDFWSSNEPGYSPLLFSMGARAAAFSVARHAVLAEGPSDMILLPTMIRTATGLEELPYQVAPGLAWMHGRDPDGMTIAARLLYLADGDEAGDGYVTSLKESGVKRDHIFQLPGGRATEDLLTPACYLTALNQLLLASGVDHPIESTALEAADGTLSYRAKQACLKAGVPKPSTVAIAQYLVDEPGRLTLSRQGVTSLRRLHARFMSTFGLDATC